MGLRLFLSTVVAAGSIAGAAWAGQASLSDFSNPVTTSFGNPGPTEKVLEGIAVGNYGILTPSGQDPYLHWYSAAGGSGYCAGGCITDDDGNGLEVFLTAASPLVGVYVGEAGQYSIAVSFRDMKGDKLGTQTVTGDDTASFAGWDGDGDSIFTIDVLPTSPSPDGLVAVSSAVASSEAVSAAPEPTAWALMLLGIGAVGFALRRRQTNVASAAA